jgi:prepilin-type N-terminal cleavage/methylation domain-containing protein
MKVPIHNNQAGVTLIELMIATIIFSVVLVIIIFAFLFVSNDYIHATIQSQTEETARSVIQQVAQDIELNNSNVYPTLAADTGDPLAQGICIGDHRYSFQENDEIGDGTTDHALVVDTVTNCTSATTVQNISTSAVNGTELLGNHMRLGNFSVTQTGPSQYAISITIAYGALTTQSGPLVLLHALAPYTYSCQSINVDGSFCAVTTLSAVVQQRVTDGS